MDADQEDFSWREDFVLEIGHGDLDEPPPPEEGGERGPRRPRDPRRVPEETTHGLTVVICVVAAVFGTLSMLTIHMSRSGAGGTGAAWGLVIALGGAFMAVFYAGGLWLGARMKEARERTW